MANKYIRHGETYCGDGTTSAAATSNGGVGAWNNINVLEGTAPAYGALAAGDTVYIRSKDNAGADITRTAGAPTVIGSAAATAASAVSWVIDNGVVWSGVDGTITYQATGGNWLDYKVNNFITALRQSALVHQYLSTSAPDGHWLARIASVVEGLKLDCSAITSGGPRYSVTFTQGGQLISPELKIGAMSDWPTFQVSGFAHITMVSPDIELTHAALGQGVFWLLNGYASAFSIIGGRLYGTGTNTAGQRVVSVINSSEALGFVRSIGFKIPRSMLAVAAAAGVAGYSTQVDLIACDTDGFGTHHERVWGYATSRTDNNPPYLSAELPNSTSTPWSWQVYFPRANANTPMSLPNVKAYTDTAGIKTIRQEILVANTLTPDRGQLWITVSYVDATTGASKFATSRASGTALATSTAAWLPSKTWGAVSFNSVKLEVTTPTSIKKDTTIQVVVHASFASATANDLMFIDPDFGVL